MTVQVVATWTGPRVTDSTWHASRDAFIQPLIDAGKHDNVPTDNGNGVITRKFADNDSAQQWCDWLANNTPSLNTVTTVITPV